MGALPQVIDCHKPVLRLRFCLCNLLNSHTSSLPRSELSNDPREPFLRLFVHTYKMCRIFWYESVEEERDTFPTGKLTDLSPYTLHQFIMFLCSDTHLWIATICVGHFRWAVNCLSIAGGPVTTNLRSLLLIYWWWFISSYPAEPPWLIPAGLLTQLPANPSPYLRRAFLFLAQFFCKPVQFFFLIVRLLAPIMRLL